MALKQVEDFLARLYVDDEFRSQFFSNPGGGSTRPSDGLSPAERERLAALSRQEVDFFANCLKHKRLSEARKLLPLTAMVLGQQFENLFLAARASSVSRDYRDDAIDFCHFLDRSPHGRFDKACLVARFEAACLQAAKPTTHIVICWLPNGSAALRNPNDRSAMDLVKRSKPTVGVWYRLTRGGKMRHFELHLPDRVSDWQTAQSSLNHQVVAQEERQIEALLPAISGQSGPILTDVADIRRSWLVANGRLEAKWCCRNRIDKLHAPTDTKAVRT